MSVLRHSIAGHVYSGMRQTFKTSLSARILKAPSIQSSSTLFSKAHSRPKSFQQATGFFHSSSIMYNKCSDKAAPADQISKDEQASSTSDAAKADNEIVKHTGVLGCELLNYQKHSKEQISGLQTEIDKLKGSLSQSEKENTCLKTDNSHLERNVRFYRKLVRDKFASDIKEESRRQSGSRIEQLIPDANKRFLIRTVKHRQDTVGKQRWQLFFVLESMCVAIDKDWNRRLGWNRGLDYELQRWLAALEKEWFTSSD